MAKEAATMNENPAFFKKACCRDCGSDLELQIHQFRDIVLCTDCVNMLFRIAEEQEEPETYYTDYTYNDLVAERNL